MSGPYIAIRFEKLPAHLYSNEDLLYDHSSTQDQDSADVTSFHACKINSNSGQFKALKVCVKRTIDILETMRQDSAAQWKFTQKQNKNIDKAYSEIKDLKKETGSKFENLSQVVNVVQESYREERNFIEDLKKMQETMKNELNELRQSFSERFQGMEENQSKVIVETGTRLMINELQVEALKYEIDTRIKAMEGELKRKNLIEDDLIQNSDDPVETEAEVFVLPKRRKGRSSTKVNHDHDQSNVQVNAPISLSKASLLSSSETKSIVTTRNTRQKTISLSSSRSRRIRNNYIEAIQPPTTNPATNKRRQCQSMSNRLECLQCRKVYTEKYLPRHSFTCKGTDSNSKPGSKRSSNHSTVAISGKKSKSASGKMD